MAITLIYPDGSSDTNASISGTSGTRYVTGRCHRPDKYDGHVRGVYELMAGSGSSATYRWVRDERVDVNTNGTINATNAYDIV